VHIAKVQEENSLERPRSVVFVVGLEVFLPILGKRSVHTVKVKEESSLERPRPVISVMGGGILSDVRLTGGI